MGKHVNVFHLGYDCLAYLPQALEQTGETTRACRFCLQVLNFLQMEGRSAFYRKFLRISSIKELGGNDEKTLVP